MGLLEKAFMAAKKKIIQILINYPKDRPPFFLLSWSGYPNFHQQKPESISDTSIKWASTERGI